MGKAPAFQFYPGDWIRDLDEHPLEIEGAWIRICCKLFYSETCGTASKSLTNWARILRVGERKCSSIIDYLDKQKIADVVNQNGTITISSRRMVRDEYIRNVRRNAGSKGGNPALLNRDKNSDLDNQNLVNQKPTPSSSSSSSSSSKENIPSTISSNKKGKSQKPLVIPEWIPQNIWVAFLQMRKSIKKPATDKAQELIIADLTKFRDRGFNPVSILEKSIKNSWQDVYEPKDGGGNGTDRPGGKRGPQPERFAEKQYVGDDPEKVSWMRDKDVP